eukprot:3392155-Amphidinium_carterae.1
MCIFARATVLQLVLGPQLQARHQWLTQQRIPLDVNWLLAQSRAYVWVWSTLSQDAVLQPLRSRDTLPPNME